MNNHLKLAHRSRYNLTALAVIMIAIGAFGLYVVISSHAATSDADFNNDGKVDISDLSILAAHYNQTGLTNAQGDANGDGVCNITDLSILASRWGSSSTTTPALGAEQAIGASLGGNQYQSDLRVDPANPNHRAVTFKTGYVETGTAIMTTLDGGSTWTSTAQASSADPDVVYDKNGVLHWTFIDLSNNTLGYRRSTDGGLTWSATKTIGPTIDHPHIVVDRSGSAFNGSIYVAGTWNLQITRSRDGGLTWATVLPVLPGIVGGEIFPPTVLKDGTLVIPFKSNFSVKIVGGVYEGVTTYVLRSTDGGVNFTSDHVGQVSQPPNPGNGGFGGLSLAVGSNGSGGQRLFMTYTLDPTDNVPFQLMMVTSDDGGITWTAPRQVAAAVPAGWGAGSCSVIVNKNGVVGIQFFSLGYIQPNPLGVFTLDFIYSKDNGLTFTAPLQIPSVSSVEPANPAQPRWVGQDQVEGDSDNTGTFDLVWTDARNSTSDYTIYSRTVTVP